MKRINFKNSLIALAIGLVMVSCGSGGGNKQQQQSATPETKTETKAATTTDVALSNRTKAEDYTAGALAKMKSLGKTEKDRRLITVGGNSDRTVYTIRTFANGRSVEKSEYAFYTAQVSTPLFEAAKYLAKEVNEADFWTHHSYEETGAGDWQSWYDTAKKTETPGNRVIE